MKETTAIIYEDNDIIIVNKPAGMIVNNVDTAADNFTVQRWVEEKLKTENLKLKTDEDSEFRKRGGVVHRLDKETSGVMILAKNEESFTNLQGQFKNGLVNKTYIALVHGEVSPQSGEIKVPVGRLPWNRMKFGILPGGRESETRYRVISNFQFQISNFKSKGSKAIESLSLIEVYPKTGRTHQIRIHMRHIGHPVFADALYAGRKIRRDDRKLLHRHFLHASKISFSHPRTKETVSFKSDLAKDLAQFLSKFKGI